MQIARVSDKAYDAFSRVASKALDYISCIIFKTLLGNILHYALCEYFVADLLSHLFVGSIPIEEIRAAEKVFLCVFLVLFYIVLYFHCVALFCVALCCVVLYCIVLCYFVLCYIVLCYIEMCCVILYCIVLCYIVLCYIVLYYIALYRVNVQIHLNAISQECDFAQNVFGFSISSNYIND